MNEHSRSYVDSLPLEIVRHFNKVCDDFEAAWKEALAGRGEAPEIEKYLGDYSGPKRTVLHRELMAIEREYRAKQGSTNKRAEDFIETPSSEMPVGCSENLGIIALEPNTLIHDRYKVVGLVGRGGMGAVYEAIDEHLRKRVALKQKLVSGAHLAKAFEREAKLLSQLNHPSLPRVIDYFSERADQFLVMDFIPGENLYELLQRRKRPFDVKVVVLWADQLLRVLQYLHRQLPVVVHRDIKPHNIKRHTDGKLVLLDFGLAKGGIALAPDSSQPSLQACTPAYAPLEQLHGSGTDRRSDVYSLAATLHHLLTGEPPANAITRATALLNRKCDPYQPAQELNHQVPPNLGQLISRMLALAINERPANVDDLLAELHDCGLEECSWALMEMGPMTSRELEECRRKLEEWMRIRSAEAETPGEFVNVHEKDSIHEGHSTVPGAIGAGPELPGGISLPVRVVYSPALRRAQMLGPVLHRAQLLWVDDNPDSVEHLIGILSSLGATIDLVTSSNEALDRIADKKYHVIISDIERKGVPNAGLDFLRALQKREPYPKIVFFITNLDPKQGTPPGAFGITNSGEELLHLVFDALERESL